MPGRIGVVVLAVLEVEVAHRVAVNAIKRQHDHHREIGQQHHRIKPVPVVKALEGLIPVLHFQVVAEPVLRGEHHMHGYPRRQPPKLDLEQAGGGVQSGKKCGEQGMPPRSGYRSLYAMERRQNFGIGVDQATLSGFPKKSHLQCPQKVTCIPKIFYGRRSLSTASSSVGAVMRTPRMLFPYSGPKCLLSPVSKIIACAWIAPARIGRSFSGKSIVASISGSLSRVSNRTDRIRHATVRSGSPGADSAGPRPSQNSK